jgi:hypothetical protein
MQMSDDATTTRTIKSALKCAFPECKFSVTRGGSQIAWTDDGPEVAAVEDVIIAAGVAEINNGFDGKRWLNVPHNSIWFDRYNVAERTAYQENAERRRVEEQARAERVNAATIAAVRAKREVINTLRRPVPEADTSRLQAGTDAFEALRQRAEAAVAIEADRQRRPSWAPPLTLEGELLELCRALNYLAPDDPPIARLWAGYADPKQSGRVLRESISTLPLAGIECRGFQLFASPERGNIGDLLFEAQRTKTGAWRFGPTLYMSAYYSPRAHEWERLIRQRAQIEDRRALNEGHPGESEEAERLTRLIAEIDAKDLTEASKHQKYSEQRTRALQLAQQRVLEFIGAPDAQMRLAARLCGHCCCCFRELTDPISLERGIGPDCYQNIVEYIRACATEPISWLTMRTGMPANFVAEIIKHANQNGSSQ